MKFDQQYFNILCDRIRKANNGTYDVLKIKDFADDPEKFIGHLRWYGIKNKDTRIVDIDCASESEKMYGINFYHFTLSDLMYPGVMAVEHLPEETRIQKMNRLWSGIKGCVLQINSQRPQKIEGKLSVAKFKIYDRVALQRVVIDGVDVTGFEQWKNFYMVVLDVIHVEIARKNRYKCLFVDNRKEFDPAKIRENDVRWFFEYNLKAI
jgi:hypothetical protein